MRIRKIDRDPSPERNYFVVDANFLANKFIPINRVNDEVQRKRINLCLEWWEEIDKQLKNGKARVYIPDLCIAETYKVLAKKYYEEHWFKTPSEHYNARKRLQKTICVSAETLRASKRNIKYHDISTNRDLIISVDRFYEQFYKCNKQVSLPDLILVATAKYLIDFFDIPKDRLHIVTLDQKLCDGTKEIYELPNAYNPTRDGDKRDRIFK